MKLPDRMLAEIDAFAEERFCSRAEAIKWLYEHRWSQSTSNKTNENTIDAVGHQIGQRIHIPRTMARAGAGAGTFSQNKQTSINTFLDLGGDASQRSDIIDRVEAVAEAIRRGEWYSMVLPKGETPESYAEVLVDNYPVHCTPEAIKDASMWLRNNPSKRTKRKALGAFLTNWCRKRRDSAGRNGNGKRTSTLASVQRNNEAQKREDWSWPGKTGVD